MGGMMGGGGMGGMGEFERSPAAPLTRAELVCPHSPGPHFLTQHLRSDSSHTDMEALMKQFGGGAGGAGGMNFGGGGDEDEDDEDDEDDGGMPSLEADKPEDLGDLTAAAPAPAP